QAGGEDIYEVRTAVQMAIERAHTKSKPTILELDTYRYYGHSVADAKHKGGYRSNDEIESYKKDHDPIQLFKRRLIAEGILTEEEFDKLSDETKAEAKGSVQFAEDSPLPEDGAIFED